MTVTNFISSIIRMFDRAQGNLNVVGKRPGNDGKSSHNQV